MWLQNNYLWHKLGILFLVLALIVPISTSCDKEKPTATSPTITTPVDISTSTPASTFAPSGTVKIGAINAWSGPTGMSGLYFADPVIKLAEKQVNDTGGILGGRELKIIKYDDQGKLANDVAGVKKLVLEDRVSVLLWGGIDDSQHQAVADSAEDHQVPYICMAGSVGSSERKFSIVAAESTHSLTTDIVHLVAKVLKAKTVAFLQSQNTGYIEMAQAQSKMIEAAGGKTVYLDSAPQGTADYMPYLTRIKYANPEVLVCDLDSEALITIAKQIRELGGWGNIKLVATSQALSAAKLPGAEGWIVVTLWMPGKDYTAARKFEQEFHEVNGSPPNSNHMFFYLSILTAIEAIKLAGTDDPLKINQAIHSGNLSFDTPAGMAHYSSEGEAGLSNMFVQIQKGGTILEIR